MKLTTLLTIALTGGAATVAAVPQAEDTPVGVSNAADPVSIFGVDMSAKNFYGAPVKPWLPGAKPGWYYGGYPWLYPWLPCLHGPVCSVLPWFPWFIQCPKPWFPPPPPKPPVHPPQPWPGWPWYPPPPSPPPPPPPPPPAPPSDGYYQTFKNLTGATQAADYLTFGLVDTVPDCKAMCNSVAGCNFANTYHDVNGKDGSKKLTCSLYTLCHTEKDAINKGGQTQPDGSINYIANSDGWCKGGQKP